MKKFGLFLLVAVVYVLHQDFWNWGTADPLRFGFLPAGLWYHAAFCLAASVLLALFVLFCWPKHLESAEPEPGIEPSDRSQGH